jgi:hypothetical protein
MLMTFPSAGYAARSHRFLESSGLRGERGQRPFGSYSGGAASAMCATIGVIPPK